MTLAGTRPPTTAFVLGLLMLGGCPGDGGGIESGDGGSGGSSTGRPTTSSDITASTLDPSDSLSATRGEGSTTGDEDDTADGGQDSTTAAAADSDTTAALDDSGTTAADTTAGDATDTDITDGETDTTGPEMTGSTDTGEPTSSSSSSSTGDSSSSSSSSSSTGDCEPDGNGNYNACLDAMDQADAALCGFGGATCINDGGDPAFVSVCSQGACLDACDCPAAPGTGNAAVTCGEIAGDDADPECYLDCSNAETCPDGMDCFIGLVCVHDSGNGAVDYAVCETGVECPIGDLCIVDDPMMPANGVCSDQNCIVAGDCPPAPATGDAPVACADITTLAGNDCFLDCAGGQTCPDGMSCFSNTLCMFPLP